MIKIMVGDCQEKLREIPDESVHTCVTSPPYFGLRDYGTGTWEGGDPDCDHVVGEMRRGLGLADSPANTRGGAKKVAEITDIKARAACPKCAATRVDQQIGLEPTPDEFCAAIVEVFREVRRVLRRDGTVWLNLGDSYCSNPKGPGGQDKSTLTSGGAYEREASHVRPKVKADGIKTKDRLMIPARVALALQADGWWLRDEIIWHKPNPMPESVVDRTTKAHEMIYLLAKSGDTTIWRARDSGEWSETPDLTQRLPRPTDEDPDATVSRWRGYDYYYDGDAIAEGLQTDPKENYEARAKVTGRGTQAAAAVRGNDRDKSGGFPPKNRRNSFARTGKLSEVDKPQFREDREPINYEGKRNKRSVWPVATKPFPEAHFATYPPELIEPCILAGSPVGGTVLDPFGGAGTTGLVAHRLGREGILIELNPEYASLAAERIRRDNQGRGVEGVERPAPEAGLPLFGG